MELIMYIMIYVVGWLAGFFTAILLGLHLASKPRLAPVRPTIRDLNPNKYNKDN